MFQIVQINDRIRPVLVSMFDELGEPEQVLTPGSPSPLVVHEYMGQLTYVTMGEGYIALAGQTFELATDDLIVMAPGCEHSFLCPSGTLHLRHWHWPQELLATDRTILMGELRMGSTLAQATTSTDTEPA